MGSQSEKKALGTSAIKMSDIGASALETKAPERVKFARRVRDWVRRKIDEHRLSRQRRARRGDACDLRLEMAAAKTERRERKRKEKEERKARREREWKERVRHEDQNENLMLGIGMLNMGIMALVLMG